MHFSYHKTLKAFLKRIFLFSAYFATALVACFFAFSLVIHFLSPTFSEEQQKQIPGEKVTAKKIFSDIFKNLKTILSKTEEKEHLKKKESQTADTNKNPSQDSSVESAEEVPKAPDQFEGQEYGNTVGVKKQPPEVQSPQEVPTPGTVQLPQEVPAPGTVQVPQEVPATGTVQSPQEVPATGTVQSPQEEVPATGTVQLPQEAPAIGTVQSPQEAPAIGTVQEASPIGTVQLGDIPSSGVSLEVQSYMAPFVYDSVNQKDPFEDPTYRGKSEKDSGQGVVIIPKTPPEEHNLEDIKLKGIIWDTKNPKALFELPGSGGYYTLIKGDKIGKNGVIFEIRESEVVVVESTVVTSGKETKEERVIKIKRINRLATS